MDVDPNNTPARSEDPSPEADVVTIAQPVFPMPLVVPEDAEPRRFVDIARKNQSAALPLPQSGALLPMANLDPEVFERLIAEVVSRQPNAGVHFYGRRGQKQHSLDIVEYGGGGEITVYQVRRYTEVTPSEITSAVEDYAVPPPPKGGGSSPARKFNAARFVLATSAAFDVDTANTNTLTALRDKYATQGLSVDVWGQEALTYKLRDAGPLVLSIFGPEWAKQHCGFVPLSSDPLSPKPLGLVVSPLDVLNLDAMAADATARSDTEPVEAARLHGIIAEALSDANFPGHADKHRRLQAKALRVGGEPHAAFDILWQVALRDLNEGRTGRLQLGLHEITELQPEVDALRQAKLEILAGVQRWYEGGVELPSATPALRLVADAGDTDAAFLACLVLEQVLVDGLTEFEPPSSLIAEVSEHTAALVEEVRAIASKLNSVDIVVQARLGCAIADTGLRANSSSAHVDAAFDLLTQHAAAGRHRHARGLVLSRAAYAHAQHGNTPRALDLWRQSILANSEDQLYGDVRAAHRSMAPLLFEQPEINFADLEVLASALPSSRRLLGGAELAELSAFEAAHNNNLPDALADTRRYLWETRLSGHLVDERLAQELLGDILAASGHQAEAVESWIIAGEASKAVSGASQLGEALDLEHWLHSPSRRRRAAAICVLGAQARLQPPQNVAAAVHTLIDLTAGLWQTSRVQPHPELDALNALAEFGVALPDSAVEPILALLATPLNDGSTLVTEAANLLAQLYWALPYRRAELAPVIAGQLGLSQPPPNLWGIVGNMPAAGREALTPFVSELADRGIQIAVLTLARWKIPTPTVQLAARRTAAALLRQQVGQPKTSFAMSSQAADTVTLLLALLEANEVVPVRAEELGMGIGQPFTSGSTMQMHVGSGDAVLASTQEAIQGQGPGQTASPIDDAADAAAGEPIALLTAVAEKFALMAEDHTDMAFVRSSAVSAIRALFPVLPSSVAAAVAQRMFAIYEQPHLNEHDQMEIASLRPLSRFRFDTGARALPLIALVAAAEGIQQSQNEETGSETTLAVDALTQMIAAGTQLVRNPDADLRRYGAITLAAAAKSGPGFAHHADALLVHPDDSVRAIAAQTVPLEGLTLELLLSDPSPSVRVRLAARAKQLPPEAVSALGSDDNVEVQRVLALALKAD